MKDFEVRNVEWEKDGRLLRKLFDTTWKNHPITTKGYFDWNLIQYYRKKPIAFCADPYNRVDLLSGVYMVMPTTIWLDGSPIDFSTSIYTFTHPSYYKKGIFTVLANAVYEECKRKGIVGTVGVPNVNSLFGFKKALKFDVIGHYDMLFKIAPFINPIKKPFNLHDISSEDDLKKFNFRLHEKKSKTGTIIGERSAEFISWRFLKCPTFKYRVVISSDEHSCVNGIIVFRRAIKKHVPIIVIMDLLIDETVDEREIILKALLDEVNRYAWNKLTPLITTLVNPFSFESNALKRKGYKKLPNALLPHESNFIFKLHETKKSYDIKRLHNFKRWHFSFADYDIF